MSCHSFWNALPMIAIGIISSQPAQAQHVECPVQIYAGNLTYVAAEQDTAIGACILDHPGVEDINAELSSICHLPAELTTLPRLSRVWIRFGECADVNELIHTVLNCPSMGVVTLYGCRAPVFPSTVISSKRIDYLELSFGRIDSIDLDRIDMPNLYYLDVRRLGVVALKGSLRRFPQLAMLDLTATRMTGLPVGIDSLRKLRELNLSHNPQYDWNHVGSVLQRCDCLREVTLEECGLRGVPAGLRFPHDISSINLAGNMLTSIPVAFTSLPRLRILYLGYNHFTHVDTTIRNIPSLQHLDLSHNKIGALPSWLPVMRKLTFLDLSGNPLQQEAVNNLRTVMPWCRIFFSIDPSQESNNPDHLR